MYSFSSWLVAAILLLAALKINSAPAVGVADANPVATNSTSPSLQRSFADWKAACAKLPSNRALRGRWPRNELLPLRTFSEFDEVFTALFDQCQRGEMSRA